MKTVFPLMGFAAKKYPVFRFTPSEMRDVKISIVLRQIFYTINQVLHELIFRQGLEMTENHPAG
jgi:hypothetical protein